MRTTPSSHRCSQAARNEAVTAKHAAAVERLKPPDPFDRLLVAQALVEPLRLLTHDKAIARHGDTAILI